MSSQDYGGDHHTVLKQSFARTLLVLDSGRPGRVAGTKADICALFCSLRRAGAADLAAAIRAERWQLLNFSAVYGSRSWSRAPGREAMVLYVVRRGAHIFHQIAVD